VTSSKTTLSPPPEKIQQYSV